MRKTVFVFAAAVALLSSPGVAEAEIERGTFRLHLESTFFSFFKGELDPDGRGDIDLDGVHFGVGAPSQEYSITRQSVGFGVTLIPNLVLGARVTLAVVHRDDDEVDDSDLFVMGFIPYLEYVFLDGMWRPFVTAVVGTEGWFGEIGDTDYRFANFVSGAGGGLHVFLAPQFSIDGTLLFSFAVGGGEWERGRADEDFDFWCIDLSLLLGLSGWI
jgi:hypothetical protein